jgi:mono/diheme cytochrome c family protein
MNSVHRRTYGLLGALVVGLLILSGCGNMREQPKLHKPYDESPVLDSAAQQLDENAVPVGYQQTDTHLYSGMVDGEPAETFPFEITREVLEEGRRYYEGFCSACHGYSGYGDGVTSLEGYPQPAPASYHIDRLRDAPNGYFFDVISNGQGQMYSYGERITPEKRWAIIAYIRAMQFSQNASVSDLPAGTDVEDVQPEATQEPGNEG